MGERTWIEQVVERVVTQVLDSHVPRLREDIVQRVMAEVQPELQASRNGEREAKPAELLRVISEIHGGTTQKEILRALLDGCSRYSGRAALFVVKSGSASGWQGRGFRENDAIKDFGLDIDAALPSQVLQERAGITGTLAEMDSNFLERFGRPANPEVILLPLLLKDKVAALVYGDWGEDGRLDSSALELLVMTTSAWLEVVSLRKQAQKDGVSDVSMIAEPHHAAAAPVSAVAAQAFNDPFAAHAPLHAAGAAAAPAVEALPDTNEDVPVIAAARAPEEPPVEDTQAVLSSEDAEVHRKAQRFAKLLVDEIKLYNQAKVSEGRKNHDIYDRLKEDIEKSRATFNKRYGSTAAAEGNYFTNEIVRSLAEDDMAMMGANFRR